MCYNCGCGLPNNPMGKGKVSEGGFSLTDDDFTKMANGWGMSVDEAKKYTYELLKQEFGAKDK